MSVILIVSCTDEGGRFLKGELAINSQCLIWRSPRANYNLDAPRYAFAISPHLVGGRILNLRRIQASRADLVS